MIQRKASTGGGRNLSPKEIPVAAMTYIRQLTSLCADDVPLVGGKTAAIGELSGALSALGIATPPGFAITAQAYRDALTAAGAWARLHALLDGLDLHDIAALSRAAAQARKIVYEAMDSETLREEIAAAWRALKAGQGADFAVAVRSSATAEDLPTASFAGQHESFLQVRGEAALLEACRRCFASIFTDRAIVYRAENGFDHFKVALSVMVMKMVRSDRACSGVIFTVDTESGHPDVVFVTGAYGLGETIVQGRVDPDEFHVHKPTFRQGFRTVLRHKLGGKQIRLGLAGAGASARLVERATSRTDQRRYCLSDDEVLALTAMALTIEEHFSARAGHWTPMDIEWAKDGPGGALYIGQARPETIAARRDADVIETYTLHGAGAVLVAGQAVGEKIASGAARVITGPRDLAGFQPGEILVATSTSPDMEPVMKTAAGIVTDRGGRTCHAAILARELGVPAVVGAAGATTLLKTGQTVTVSCADGDIGKVFDGAVAFEVTRTPAKAGPATRTKVMVNLANPGAAFKASLAPVMGVGLARMEFIISERVRVHPMALAHPERIAAKREAAAIAKLTAGAAPEDYFVRQVSEGVGTIAAAFHPRPVIVRLSDFKTNEYASLLGGGAFEPTEENPMLGFRGAARYIHPRYADAFALECRALRRVREAMGLKNLQVMVPFCRSPAEGRAVIAAMAANGLRQGEDGLKVIVMCEIPNNVIQIDAFAEIFDGFSIGSNDLTQLVLGVDRDSEVLSADFDERDPGVLEMIRQAIAGAHRHHRSIGICGEAPATYPEVARFVVGLGIDSVSVNPASAAAVTALVADCEASAQDRQAAAE